jgi:abortive infection bacteriophage resistance protein
MPNVKPATTYKEQIEKLRSRGCVIADESKATEILSKLNYYHLTAYFLPFKKGDSTYIDGTSFETVYHIYEFDKRLRHILFSAIEEVEMNFRSAMAYYHAHKYGPLGYINNANYDPKHHNHSVFMDIIKNEISNRKKEKFVQHHQAKYGGNFPKHIGFPADWETRLKR